MNTLFSRVCRLSFATLLATALPLFSQAPATPEAPDKKQETQASDASKQIENSVVRVYATSRAPDILKPWTKMSPSEKTGSGVVIDGKRILTNAHVVLYASQVQIQANQSGDRLSATVEYCVPAIDLAVLKLEDETFFDTHAPVPRDSKLPELKQSVMAYGYPTGGTTLSITKGIVSRIDFVTYGWPVQGLRIQIDAAINPGNSGGPAISGDKMIGLAFSLLSGSQNIGYIIPCEEIEIFLKDVEDGKYDGKPGFFDDLQTLENSTLRPFLKLQPGTDGIIVNEVVNTSADNPLKKWDLITHIGDTPVDNQGMIKTGGLRLRFAYLIQHLVKDGKVPLTIVRDGQSMKVSIPVPKERPALIPNKQGQYPSYFIYGPIVFSEASSITYNLFSSAQAGNAIMGLAAISNPLVTRRGDAPAFEGEELVFIPSPFFPHKLAKGYSMPFPRVIEAINGIKIRNLKHLVEVLRDSKEQFTVITFSGKPTETLVFPHKEMVAATEQILNDNGVRSQASPELLPVWNKK